VSFDKSDTYRLTGLGTQGSDLSSTSPKQRRDDSWLLIPSPVSSFFPNDETVSFQSTPQAPATYRHYHDDAALPISTLPACGTGTRSPAELLAIEAKYVCPDSEPAPLTVTAVANARPSIPVTVRAVFPGPCPGMLSSAT
jgi:hypothetical protein